MIRDKRVGRHLERLMFVTVLTLGLLQKNVDKSVTFREYFGLIQ